MEGFNGGHWERDWNGAQARIRKQRRAMPEKLETRVSTLSANEIMTRYFQSTEMGCSNVDKESKDTKEFLTILRIEDQFPKLGYSGNKEGRDELHKSLIGEHWADVDIKGTLLAPLKISHDSDFFVENWDSYGCPQRWGTECNLTPTRADMRELDFCRKRSSRTRPLIEETSALLEDDSEDIGGQSGYWKGLVVDLCDATLEREDGILDLERFVGQRLLSLLEYSNFRGECVDLFLGDRVETERSWLLHVSLQRWCELTAKYSMTLLTRPSFEVC